jgi:hypothetical protein
MNNQNIQPVHIQNNPVNPANSQIGNIINFYYRNDADGNLITHSKLSELITLIHIAFDGIHNMRSLLTKINDKCHKGHVDDLIDNYMDMVNMGQIELHMAVKELFTIDDLKYYGL